MACAHTDFRSIRTVYDRRRGVLVFHWTCDRCGELLGEARREPYRPSFDPRGHERFMPQRVSSA
jgi:hypothetical protein